MACYDPIPAYQHETGAKPTLRPPITAPNLALPCGRCIGCRTDQATAWAHRCSHETTLYRHNIAITLTYDDVHVPTTGHLELPALQRFFKRLRKLRETRGNALLTERYRGDEEIGIRYFACGEYGGKTQRPHYHAILFNCDFADKYKVAKDYHESPTLKTLWPFGGHRIGIAGPRAASYIAQYSLKKIGDGSLGPDGQKRPPPFLRMSLKPAIGAKWVDKYPEDLQHGYLVDNARRQRIPRAYKERLKKLFPELAEEMAQRVEKFREERGENENDDPARRKDAELIHKRRKQLIEKRTL